MNTSGGWLFWALLSAGFAGLTAILAKVGVQGGVDADMATLVRTIIIAILLTLFVRVTGKWCNPLQLPMRTLVFLGFSAIATGASWVCYFRALQLGQASQVAPVDKLSVVLVVVFAALFLGERPSLRDWFGVALIACGVMLLAIKK